MGKKKLLAAVLFNGYPKTKAWLFLTDSTQLYIGDEHKIFVISNVLDGYLLGTSGKMSWYAIAVPDLEHRTSNHITRKFGILLKMKWIS